MGRDTGGSARVEVSAALPLVTPMSEPRGHESRCSELTCKYSGQHVHGAEGWDQPVSVSRWLGEQTRKHWRLAHNAAGVCCEEVSAWGSPYKTFRVGRSIDVERGGVEGVWAGHGVLSRVTAMSWSHRGWRRQSAVVTHCQECSKCH